MNLFLRSKRESFFKRITNKIVQTAKIAGPGVVTGAADDDPSGIGTYSVAGAKYGLKLAWLSPFLFPFMFVIQEMCARIGLVTGQGLTANMKKYFPKPLLYAAISILIFANVINIGADINIMASCLSLMFGSSLAMWAILISCIIIMLEVFISYHAYSKILLGLSAFLLAYVFTAFITTQDWLEVLKYTFTPHFKFDKDFMLTAVAFVGTTISPYLFFWQASQELEDVADNGVKINSRVSIKKALKKTRIDTFVGMFYSQLIALFIVVTCFSTLHKHNITDIVSASDAAMALRPLAGEWAFLIFTLGIIGAGFLGISVLAGSGAYALAALFNYKEGLSYKFREAVFFYSVIIVSTLAGLGISFIGINPIKALVYAAVVNALAAIPLIVFIMIIANKTHIMGEHKNGFFSNVMVSIIGCLMFFSAIILFI